MKDHKDSNLLTTAWKAALPVAMRVPNLILRLFQ